MKQQKLTKDPQSNPRKLGKSSQEGLGHPRMHWSGKRSTVLSKPIKLSSGDELAPVEVAYETWGTLNEDKSNALLICHALSGDAHVANGGVLPDGTVDESGWWSEMVGPGKPIDTNHYFVICSNVIGGCSGTTGPSSARMGAALPSVRFASVVDEPEARAFRAGLIDSNYSHDPHATGSSDDLLQDPAEAGQNIAAASGGDKTAPSPLREDASTSDRYGTDFPLVTVDDMVRVQKQLLDVLGIQKLACVVGGSLGGMQALTWTKLFPNHVKSCIAIATTWHATAQNIAFNEIGRQAILGDPQFCDGQYDPSCPPKHGLAVARMLGHVTYLSASAMDQKFGTDLVKEGPSFELSQDFQVESYLTHQGNKFVDRFDANTYLYLTKALDYYALVDDLSEIEHLYQGTDIKFVLLSFSSDWLFPTSHIEPLAFALTKAGAEVSFSEIASDAGHDSFLLPCAEQDSIVSAFLSSLRRELKVSE